VFAERRVAWEFFPPAALPLAPSVPELDVRNIYETLLPILAFTSARVRGQSHNSNILTRVSPQLPAIACVGPHGNAMLVASKINDTEIF
jgi:hypothetical protein